MTTSLGPLASAATMVAAASEMMPIIPAEIEERRPVGGPVALGQALALHAVGEFPRAGSKTITGASRLELELALFRREAGGKAGHEAQAKACGDDLAHGTTAPSLAGAVGGARHPVDERRRAATGAFMRKYCRYRSEAIALLR